MKTFAGCLLGLLAGLAVAIVGLFIICGRLGISEEIAMVLGLATLIGAIVAGGFVFNAVTRNSDSDKNRP